MSFVGRLCLGIIFVLSSSAASRAFAQPAAITSYQQVSEVRVTRTVSLFTYRAVLSNPGPALSATVATVTSNSPATTVVDGQLSFGPIASGGTALSSDTFSFRHDRTVPFSFSNLEWVIAAPSTEATHLRISTLAPVRAGDQFNVVVEALDAADNVASSFTGSVNLSAAATGGSNFNGGTASVAAVSGIATFVGLALNDAANGYVVTATSAGLTNGVSNAFTVTARQLVVTSVIANMQAGTTFSTAVEARDGNNAIAENFASSVNLNAAATGGSNFNGGTANVGAVAGLANFSGLSLNDAANNYTLTASSAGVINGLSNAFNVTATHLAVLTIANVRAGDAFNVTTQARDANNNVAENFTGNVNLDAAATGGSNFNGGTANVAAASGVASFVGLVLNDAADGYVATAASAGLTNGVSNAFNVTARQLVVTSVIANMQAGTSFSTAVEARDGNNAIAENFASSVNLNAAATGGSNFNGGTATTAAVAGTATFSGLALNDAADNYTLTASSAGIINGLSNAFNVTATHLAVLTIANVRAGDAFNVTTQARDANNNVAENFTGNVNLDAAATGGSNFNGGTANVAAVSGVASFVGLVLNDAANGYVATAASAGLTNGVSNTFNVTARQLVITTVIANMQVGTSFGASIEARDGNNALAENFNSTVALDAAAPGGSNFNGGTASVGAVGGTASFTGLVLNTAANGYALIASSAGVINGVSNTFNVTSTPGGVATHLRVRTLTAVRAGDPFTIVVDALDAAENIATFSGNVSLNAAATGGSNFNGGTANVAAVSGIATFVGLALNDAANGYVVTATSAGLTNGVSNAFNVTARQLVITTVVANMQAGTTFSTAVEARDGNNTIAENFASNVSLNAAATGGSNFNGGTANVGAVAGQATFVGLALNDAANSYGLTASSAGLINGLSNAFNVTATHLAVLTIANVRAGDASNVTTQARDANNNVAENFTGNVNLNAAAAGGSNFNGGTANVAAVSGVASFVGLVLSDAANGYVGTAASPGLTNGVSNAFNVTARQLVITTVVANMQAGTTFSTAVEARDGNNTIAENFASNVSLNAAATGGSNFNGGTANVGAVAGQATFVGLALNDAANSYGLTASSAGLINGLSNAFNVTATHLAVLTIANVRAGDAFNVTTQARDANNNVAENFTGNVNLNAAATGGSNFNGGTANVAAVSGVASFVGLVLNDAANGYVGTAASTGLTNGVSNTFNVAARQLVVTTVIANMSAGTSFSVSVESRDANNAVAENFNSNVVLNAAASGGANFTGGTKNANAAAGLVTFSGLALSTAANGYVVTAGGAGLIDGISNAFNVTATGSATHLRVRTVSDVRAGNLSTIIVEALDAAESIATSFTGNVSLNAGAVGGSNFVGGTKNAAAVAGIATFSSVVLNDAANSYVVTATSAGLTGAKSNAFKVTALQLVVTSVIANMQAGTVFGATVEARDANNAIAENFSSTVALNAAATGGSNFNGGTVNVAAVAGMASFNGLALNNAANSYLITASSAGPINGVSNSFNVTATHLAVLAIPDRRAGDPFNITAHARDANNNVAENFAGAVNLTAAAVGGSNFVGGTKNAAAAAGIATFSNVVLNDAANSYVVTATSVGLTGAKSNAFSVTALQLVITTVVANMQAGTVFSTAVEARDANNAIAENFNSNVALNAAAVGGSNVNGGTANVGAVAGMASFNGLALNNAADGYTLTASSPGPNNGGSNAFNVTADHLTFVTVPASTRSGVAFTIVVQGRDANNALAENFTGNVDLDAFAIGGSNFAGGTVTTAASAGVATLNTLVLNNAADDYFAQASSTGLTGATSATFDVFAHHLTVTTVIANQQAGTAFSVNVQARDGNNNVAENFNSTLALNATAAGGSNFNGGQQNVPAIAGLATFPNLVLNNAADGYMLTASGFGPNNGGSNAFNVTADHLTFVTVPASTRSGVAFTIVVQGRDANNALAENFTGNVDLDAFAIGGSNFAGGTVTTAASAGVATLNTLVLNNAADDYFAQASSTGLTGATSATFDVFAHHLTVTTVIANQQAGTAFSVNVQARDGNNNVAENFNSSIALNASAAGGANFNGGQQTATGLAGNATFPNLVLNNAADGYMLTASGFGPSNGGSNAFNVTADHLTFVTVPASTRSGVAFTIVVQGRDANNALAENFTGNVDLDAFAIGGSNFAGGTVTTAASAGVATLNTLVLNNAADDYFAQASSTGLTGATSATFDVFAHHLTVTTVIANQQAGTAFSVNVQARDGNNNVAENFNSSLALNATAAGGSNFNGGQQNVPAIAGLATFPNLVLNNAADGYMLTASGFGPSNGGSNAFNVTADHLTFVTVPASTRSGVAFTIVVQGRDANNALAENFTGNVDLDAFAIGGSNFAGGTVTTAASAGVATLNTLVLNNAADDYFAQASSTGLTGATSATFDIFAHHLTVTTVIANMTAGTTFNVSVQARDGNNNVAENFNSSIALNASAAGGANFNGGQQTATGLAGNATFPGLVLATPANNYVVTASSSGPANGLSNSFNVTAPTMLRLSFSADSPDLNVGETMSLTATAHYSDGTSEVVTDAAKWSAQDVSIAGFDGPGQLRGIEPGETTISVVLDDVSDVGVVSVSPALQSISIEPASPVIVGSGSRQFSAIGTYSDGSTQDITRSVAWSSTDTSIASIDAAGLAHAGSSFGTVTIVAASGTTSADARLSVISSDTRFVYATASAGIAGFAVDPDSGNLNPVPGSPFCLTTDCAPGEKLARDPLGRFVFATVGSEIRSYAIDPETGTLTLTSARLAGSLQDVAVDPTGRHLFAVDVNAMLASFTIDASSGALTSAGDPIAAGDEPTSILIHPSGRFLYLTSRFGSITGIGVDSATGMLTALPGLPAVFGPATTTPSQSAISPSGSHLFVPRVYVNTDGLVVTDLATLAIDATTGAVTFASAVAMPGAPSMSPTGSSAPLVQPSGRFLHIVMEGGGSGSTLGTFAIDPSTGTVAAIPGGLVIATRGVNAQAMTPAGDAIYLGGYDSPGIERFAVDPSTGAVTTAGGFFGKDTFWRNLILVSGVSAGAQD